MHSNAKLVPQLSLLPAVALVIGSIIGSGIFVCSSGISRSLPSSYYLIAVWIAAGGMTLLGALSLSELACAMPKTGGPYEFLKNAYGEPWGYAFGWANFAIAGSGGIAATAFLSSSCLNVFVPLFHLGAPLEKWPIHIPFLGDVFPLASLGLKFVSALMIIFLTWINVRGIRLGAWVQSISTTTKLVLLLGIIVAAFAFDGRAVSLNLFSASATASAIPVGWALVTAFAAALSSAFWAYDGWANLSYLSGEIKNPVRTVPRAILMGTGTVIVVYVLINIAYVRVLPIANIMTAPGDNTAAAMMEAVVGHGGALFVSALIMLSAFDCTNAGILTNARIYYSMALDGCFARSAGLIHDRFGSPHRALWMQMCCALLLVATGSFELISSMYVFVNWVFYLVLVLAVFVQRRKTQTVKSSGPFRIPFYPWPPLIFALFASVFLAATLVGDITNYVQGIQPIIKSAAGIALVLIGYPLYGYWKRAPHPFED